jgi:membrane fusion protein (multidrug efflux system)
MEPGAVIFAGSASWADRNFEGVVRTVNSRVNPVTRAFVVRAHILNEDGALRPGMLLTVRVVTQERMALIISENAVLQSGARSYVYVVGDDDIARQQDIQIESRQYGIVEVASGLAPGDSVVTDGLIKLRDGATVRYPAEQSSPEFTGVPAPGMGMSMGATTDAAALPANPGN